MDMQDAGDMRDGEMCNVFVRESAAEEKSSDQIEYIASSYPEMPLTLS
ncbi:MAG: hypothetical protein JRJ03_06065 [Deltaproteobacteria bacterium]|nr:hypothetical protein [Deltaproteobacteria bacterium]